VNEELVDIIFKISQKFHREFIKNKETDETRKIALTYTSFILHEYFRLTEENDEVQSI
jgi:hypothetical protein